MAVLVDARGLSCPQPVMLARKAILAGVFPIEVIVDDDTALMNVRRQAARSGLTVEVTESGDEFRMTIDR